MREAEWLGCIDPSDLLDYCRGSSPSRTRPWFAWLAGRDVAARVEQRRLQCEWLRDIMGNPFQPARLEPAWLQWEEGAIKRMARSIYEERRFSDLPNLADALAEAGCADSAILDHCRQPGMHVRGCWVVDLCLGRE